MLLQEVINICKYSELNTLSVKDNDEAIVAFINLGLLELYNIFALKSEEFLIELQDGVTIYDLPDNFMYMTGAFESPDEGQNSKPVPINEDNNPFSINTINFSQVQIPLSTKGAYISIIYVVRPNHLSVERLSDRLPIPDNLVQPLLNFVAYKAHGAIRLDGQQSEGDVYYARFIRSCDDVKRLGTSIASDDLSMSTRIYSRGFP